MGRKKNKQETETSSSEEDNAEQIRQAVDGAFFTDDMFKNFNKNNNKDKTDIVAAKSQRCLPNEELQVDVRVSGEMQRHVGEKLARIIANMVEYVDVGGKKAAGELHRVEGGVRLLKDSKRFLTTDAPHEVTLSRRERKEIKRRKVEVEEDIRLDNVVVSPQYVLSGESTRHWKSRRKEKLVTYKEGQVV